MLKHIITVIVIHLSGLAVLHPRHCTVALENIHGTKLSKSCYIHLDPI